MGCAGCNESEKAIAADRERIRGQRNRALNVLVAIAGRLEELAEAQEEEGAEEALKGARNEQAIEDIADLIDQWLVAEESGLDRDVSRETGEEE